jgi:hypothetical protein
MPIHQRAVDLARGRRVAAPRMPAVLEIKPVIFGSQDAATGQRAPREDVRPQGAPSDQVNKWAGMERSAPDPLSPLPDRTRVV